MSRVLIPLAILAALGGCPGKEPADTGDTGDAADTGDTSGTGDTSDTTDTADSADTGDRDPDDTAIDTDTGSSDTGTDTGDTSDTSDTSGDTGADTGEPDDTADPDTDTDTGTDTGEDTATSACTWRDLDYTAEVRDSTGAAGTTFTPRQALTFVGIVTNPCAADVTFPTPSSCLVDGAEAVDASGMGMGVGIVCSGAVTTWTVPAGGSIEEELSWGTLSSGSWDVTVQFAHSPNATTAITIR